MHNYRKPHSWNAICDICGFKFKADQLRKRWDGLMACDKDWEPRHPQELIRVPKENPAIPWSRPEAVDSFVVNPYRLQTEAGPDLLTEDGDILI